MAVGGTWQPWPVYSPHGTWESSTWTPPFHLSPGSRPAQCPCLSGHPGVGPGERGARLSLGLDLSRRDLPLPERHLLVGSRGAMIMKLLIWGSSVAWTTLPKPPDMCPASTSCLRSRPIASAASLTLRHPEACLARQGPWSPDTGASPRSPYDTRAARCLAMNGRGPLYFVCHIRQN